jgi:rubredoxin
MKRLRIPPIFCDLVQTTFSSCNGLVFDRSLNCPDCGGTVTGYDRKKRQFAVLTDGTNERIIDIYVKRFRCSACGSVFSARAPFYPKTRIASPIVDLCLTLGQTMHFSRVSDNLAYLGIIVDRWTIRNYVMKYGSLAIPTTELYGIKVPLSLVNLTVLFAGRNERETIDPQDVLTACWG